ncbi:MgtC/SapB family protein [Marinobacter sp. CHS3-4]|uniref:MgtC/SapB family protein n=1 Tax=Marinobacter sp. CHS3-4 TaxID=3045174 RepID=UPI0024B51588|nr:MgtC/SapB family protein [Marinobacter sp. CHS3-4]MDI9246025.1 MgtC/SapB family protein [Marinobacter sp. CHS3-4]
MDDIAVNFLDNHATAINLLIALLLGAVVGLERGWGSRNKAPGERIAGIRTFALIGLMGGFAALLAEQITPWVFPAMLIGLIAIALVAFNQQVENSRNVSITGIVGMVLTFCYGAVAVVVDPILAIAAAVITAIILDNKAEIHGVVARLQEHELDAALKLLAISVVLLPLLPDEGHGPGDVLNPRAIWWMVVLIASVSFVGYFAVKIFGTGRGILFTSVFAGLSSSTALTLHYARQSNQSPELCPQLASGILIACGTMFPRILVYCLLINPALLADLWLPVVAMSLCLFGPAAVIWKRNQQRLLKSPSLATQNPLELTSALTFGALLTLILLLGQLVQEWAGNAGILALAAASGIADVDAITLSLSRMSQNTLSHDLAIIGIVVAATVNNLVKTGMAGAIGDRALGLQVAGPMVLSLVVGLTAAIAL